MDVQLAKQQYAVRTHRGADLVLGGVLLWSVFGGLGLLLPESPERALVYLFGAGLLLPLGLLIAAARGRDLLVRDNPLSMLAGLLGAVKILFIPLMLGAYFLVPEAVPWFLEVLVGAHFLPFSWLYDSPAYLFCSVAITAVSAGTGLLLPAADFTATPFAVALALLATVALLARERRVTRKDAP